MVLVAPAELLPPLLERTAASGAEILGFTDVDAIGALETILVRKPSVVALEHTFSTTPRGSALIGRIQDDPDLAQSEIRVVSHDGTSTQLVAPRVAPAPEPAAAPPIDYRGTRRARRFAIAGQPGIMIDGTQATLIDLSAVGAQVVSTAVLKPNQRVRVTLPGEHGPIRCGGIIAWASFEIAPKTGPRYRAGIELVGADAAALEAFCAKHKA
jgi:hypothetical protein